MNFVPSYFKLQYLEICMISNKEVRKLVISLCTKINVFKNLKKKEKQTRVELKLSAPKRASEYYPLLQHSSVKLLK